MSELQITARQLKALVTPVLPIAGKDDMLPVLCSVRIETDGPWLLAMATDRFRLAVKRVRAPEGTVWPKGWAANVPTRTLRGILGVFKPGRDADPQLTLSIEKDGHGLRVQAGGLLLDVLGASITYPLESGEFPDLRKVLREALAYDVEPGAYSGFNWAFLSDFKAGAAESGGSLHFRVTAAAKPSIVTDGEDFIGGIMPRRVIGSGEGKPGFPTLEDWTDLLADPKPANKTARKKAPAKKAAARKKTGAA